MARIWKQVISIGEEVRVEGEVVHVENKGLTEVVLWFVHGPANRYRTVGTGQEYDPSWTHVGRTGDG
jgi:hypothetical protein